MPASAARIEVMPYGTSALSNKRDVECVTHGTCVFDTTGCQDWLLYDYIAKMLNTKDRQACVHSSDFVLADLSVRSPRKLVMFIVKTNVYMSKYL